jgi:hypothetical protein
MPTHIAVFHTAGYKVYAILCVFPNLYVSLPANIRIMYSSEATLQSADDVSYTISCAVSYS